MHSVEIHLISKLYIEVKRAINIYAHILVYRIFGTNLQFSDSKWPKHFVAIWSDKS